MSVDESRPATWLTYKPITTPMAAGPMIDMFDITHVSLCDGKPSLSGRSRVLVELLT
jgi:hypothetical protein